MESSKVCITKTSICEYPKKDDLFRPSLRYPEYIFNELSNTKNEVYDLIRQGFHLLKLDDDNFGKKEWNPLKGIVNPGDTVLIKPNMVMDHNPVGTVNCLYTHPSLVAAVIDYILIAQKGDGKIIVGDAPVQECNFEKLVSESGYSDLISFYKQKGFDIALEDFRDLKSENINGVYHQNSDGKRRGIEVKLDQNSEFYNCGKSYKRLRITNYNPKFMFGNHNDIDNIYYINKSVLSSDVVINMPKPKTHRKAGVTISLKNLVGINSRKEYLPHHTMGSLSEGGDEYLHKSLFKKLKSALWDIRNTSMSKGRYTIAYMCNVVNKFFGLIIKLTAKDGYSEGSWYGNNTISKTIVDLNKIIFYADKEGILKNEIQRRNFIVADMIIAGEKDGPLLPSDKNVGIIAMGDNPLSFDTVIAKIMGANIEEIPTIDTARNIKGKFKLPSYEGLSIVSNDARWNEKSIIELEKEGVIRFMPTDGWKKVFKE